MKNDKIIVLYLDDEVNNLHSFRATFRREFKIHTAVSAEEGFDVLQNNEVHIIISDQRMANTTGVEFFKSILKDYPEPIRILLTGYADIEAVIASINEAQVYQYLTKPWDENELRNTIMHAYKTLQLRKDKDEELNYFIYKASHDLKGPLVSINGLLDLARKEQKNEENLNRYLNLIEHSISGLDDTLNDLIEYKKMDQALVKYSIINFEDLIEEVLRGVRHMDHYSEIQIRTRVSQVGNFKNDRGVLRSILLNLIQNAIKYRRYNISEPFVSITVEANENEATLEIKDNGQGMPDVVLQNVFRMFYRANSETQGSGLGLYIVKTGMKKLGGEISVESVQREGTTFKLVIPNNNNATILKRENVLKDPRIET